VPDRISRLPSLQEILPPLAVLILSLSFHEAAHAWTADKLGDPTARQLGRLTLNPLSHIDWIGTVLFPLIAFVSGVPLIGWAKPVPVDMRNLRHPRRDFAIVAVAGPISNLILALIAAILFKTLAATSGPVNVMGQLLLISVLMNVMLAIFNMIPVPPLDGGNVLMGIVPLRVARAVDWLRPYGFVIIYALMLTGVLSAITRPVQSFLLSFLL
jgi:Zn-dependent protease